MSALVAAIADPARPTITKPVVVVVAHPDDETLGCGALLARLHNLTIVHVTDGAPRNGEDARRHGFADPAAYAAARRRELDEALRIGGAGHARRVSLGVPDQGVASALADIARRLVPHLRDADLVLTHACEGGHPDHDGTAWAVSAAAEIVTRDAGRSPAIAAMPLYREGAEGGWLVASFDGDPAAGPACRLVLGPDERARKAAMLAAHASQAETLAGFGVGDELFRIAGPGPLSELPNGGRVLYDRYAWGATGAELVRRAALARAELGL